MSENKVTPADLPNKVYCTVIVQDEEEVKKHQNLTMLLPGGRGVPVPLNNVIGNLVKGIYHLMHSLNQKEIAIHLDDKSSGLVIDKDLRITITSFGKDAAKGLQNIEEG